MAYFNFSLEPASELRRELVRGSAGNFLVKVSAMLLALLSSIVLARLLGAGGYGVYAFAISAAGLLAVPVQFGLPQYLTRECAINRRRARWTLVKGMLVFSSQLVFVAGVLLAAVAALAVLVLDLDFRTGAVATEPLLWAFILLPLLGLAGIRTGALRGLGHVVLAQLAEDLVRPLTLLGSVSVIYWIAGGNALDALTTVKLYVLAAAVAFCLGAWLLLQHLPRDFRSIEAAYSRKLWLRDAAPFLVLAGAHLVLQYTDILMLGILGSAEDTGIYNVVIHAGSLVAFGLTLVNTVIAPHIARLKDSGDQARLQKLVTYASRTSFLFAVPVLLVYLLLGQWLLEYFFGAEFGRGQTALAILAVGQAINAGMGSVALILNMSGYAWYSTYGVIISAISNVVLNALLIPPFGIEGAAVATAVSLAIWNVILASWVKQKVGVVSLPW